MHFGVVTVSCTPLRLTPAHQAEMNSQLLYGEVFTIISQEKDWCFIETETGFEAYIQNNHFTKVSQADYKQHYSAPQKTYCFDVLSSAITNREHIPLLLGSVLHQFDGLSYKLEGKKIIFNGQVISPSTDHPEPIFIQKTAFKYLNTPYLYGGRSIFGIDTTGFVQMVCKLNGVNLPRTIQQQFAVGKQVQLLAEAKMGDLAFFERNGELSHVGILISDTEIIHCEERVKVSSIDSHGIFNSTTKQYSHQLRMVKRVFL